MLAEILALCDCYNLQTREFYFDRSPKIFENILGLYRKGELHLTENVCPRDFIGELDYWGLSALHLGIKTRNKNNIIYFEKHSEPCCAYTLQRASWLLPIVESTNDEEEEVDLFEGMCCANLRNLVWKLFEDPNSSKAARVSIKLSLACLILNITEFFSALSEIS